MRRGDSRARFSLENYSGYSSQDLRVFVSRGLYACGVQARKHVIFVSSPIRSRGCAEVSGDKRGAPIIIAIASPSKFSMRRLARLFEHECAHAKGLEHDDMNEALLYSEGPIPMWARGLKMRYLGRAPDQMRRLR